MSTARLIVTIVLISFVLGAFLAVDAATEGSVPGQKPTAGGGAQGKSATSYFKDLYAWLLGLVGIASLFAIVYGGVLYIFSGAVDSTAEARKWITNALTGLVVAGLSWLLLYTINPELVKEFSVENIIQSGLKLK